MGRRCVEVGDRRGHTDVRFPPADTFAPEPPTPELFVDARSPAGGSGTEASPFQTIAEAVGTRTQGTLRLAAGEYPMSATVRLDGRWVIVGTGTDDLGTRLVPTAGAGFEVGSRATATPSEVTCAGLSMRYVPMATANAFTVSNRATLRLRDVAIVGAYRGIDTDESGVTLDGEHVTIRGSHTVGVTLGADARGIFRSLLVRETVDPRGQGIVTQGGHFWLSEVLITCNGLYGIGLLGNPRRGTGWESCAGDVPAMARGDLDCARDVSVQDEAATGVYLGGTYRVEARTISVGGTRGFAGSGGDGIAVLRGGSVDLDPELTMSNGTTRGVGSELVGNRRAGVLADGASSVVALHGTMVRDNVGPGIFVQNLASAQVIERAQVERNGGVGLGFTDGTRAEVIQGNGIVATRVLPTMTTVGMVELADGLLLNGATMGMITGNEINQNARFGLLVMPATTATVTANRGTGNLYGIGNYSTMSAVSGNTLTGTRDSARPAMAPLVGANLTSPTM